jgi:5'-phosphate synthase pdxT subunit
MLRVGVLALQGGFAAHAATLAAAGAEPVLVRGADALADVGALVLPGGESTVQSKLIERFGLRDPLEAFVRSGRPVLATCAGLILSARGEPGATPQGFGWLDVVVRRNAYGRQVDSFVARDDRGELEMLFIRAPRIVAVGPAVEVLFTLQGEPVAVRQGNVYGAAFHPELRGDPRLHRQAFGLPARPPRTAAAPPRAAPPPPPPSPPSPSPRAAAAPPLETLVRDRR